MGDAGLEDVDFLPPSMVTSFASSSAPCWDLLVPAQHTQFNPGGVLGRYLALVASSPLATYFIRPTVSDTSSPIACACRHS